MMEGSDGQHNSHLFNPKNQQLLERTFSCELVDLGRQVVLQKAWESVGGRAANTKTRQESSRRAKKQAGQCHRMQAKQAMRIFSGGMACGGGIDECSGQAQTWESVGGG